MPAKFIRGIRLEADTGNIPVVIQLQGDGVTIQTVTAQHDGRTTVVYAFAASSLITAYETRLVPQGNVRIFSYELIPDEYPDLSVLVTPWTDSGIPAPKYIRAVTLEADTGGSPINCDIQIDGSVVAATIVTNHAGKSEVTYPFAAPFTAYETRIVPAGNIRVFGYRFIYDQYPDLKAILSTIDDQGYFGDKYIRGVVIEADTGGATVAVTIQGDGSAISPALSLVANGKRELDFTFASPFIARELQLVPAGDVRLFKVRWIYDQYPELNRLITSVVDASKRGDKYVRGLLLEVDSGNAPATIDLVGDGAVKTTLSFTANGKMDQDFVFNPPFIAREIQFVPKTGNVRIFSEPHWYFDNYPELNQLISSIVDANKPGDKYVRGLLLEVDTGNQPATIDLVGDGTVKTTLSLTTNGKTAQDFSFGAPFIAREIQLIPKTGSVRIFNEPKWRFDDYPELNQLVTAITNEDKPGDKYFRGVLLELDTGGAAATINIVGDGVVQATLTVTATGRSEKDFTFASPFIAREIQLVPTSGNVRIFGRGTWIFDDYPELNQLVTSIVDAGKRGDKYIRGLLLEIDTGNVAATIDLVGDGVVQTTLSVTAGGKSDKDFAFTSPFIAREIQLIPKTGNVRIFSEPRWYFDEYPELNRLITPIFNEGKSGDKYFRGVVLELDTGGVAATVDLVGDGVVQETLSVTATGRSEKDFTFNPPFIAREIQLVPQTGNIRIFGAGAWIFDDYPELNRLVTAITDEGKPGDKYFRGTLLEVDTGNAAATIDVVADGVVVDTLSVTANGRSEKDFVFSPPFIAREIQLVPTSGNVRIFGSGVWAFDSYPLLNAMVTEWDDAGLDGAKFVQGVILDADTSNALVVIQVQGDEGVLGATITATHNGRSAKAYPESTGDTWIPFVAHKLRLVPQGSVRIFHARFVFEPEPESATFWKTQPTTFDWPGFGHAYRAQIAHKSTSNITMTVTVDGVDYSYTISNSAGAYVKTFITLKAIKGKAFQFSFSAAEPFRLYKRDLLVMTKAHGDVGVYQSNSPYGGNSRTDGAAI